MGQFEYWKSLGFDDKNRKEIIRKGLRQLKQGEGKMLSKAKVLLVEVILTKNLNIKNSMLRSLYNRSIYPRVEAINNARVKNMQN